MAAWCQTPQERVQPSAGAGREEEQSSATRSVVSQREPGPWGDVCDPAHLIDLPSPFEPSPLSAIYLASAEIKGIEKNQ